MTLPAKEQGRVRFSFAHALAVKLRMAEPIKAQRV